MTAKKQIWKCEICGNIIEVLHEGSDTLVCCGQPMNLQEEKNDEEGKTDTQGVPTSWQKHKPIIEGNIIKVGSVEHPRESEHCIEWIEATDGKETAKIFISPEEKPKAAFSFKPSSARVFCNLHGLWTSN